MSCMLVASLACVWLAQTESPTPASASPPAPAPAIRVSEVTVFNGNAGWPQGDVVYRLACGACVARMPNGDLLCWWLSGSAGEPSTDNNVLASRSRDNGATWGEPYILIKAGERAGALTAVQVTEQGKVIAFGAEWPAELEYTVWHYFRMESTDSGHTWGPREPIHVRAEDNLSFGSPIRLRSGEYLLPASFFEKRSKPLTASIEALAHAGSELEALALASDPATAAGRNKFLTHLHGCSVLTASDPDLRDLTERGAVRNRPLGLLEGTVVQLETGRIVMLMRAEYGGYLWRTESDDDGRTWSEARQTDIPNPTSLASMIRLPDGRIALVHNAVTGGVGRNAPRDPLSIWLSDDELESWYLKEDIITGGQLAYPHPLIVNGELVFCYDRNRREVRFVRVSLPPPRTAPRSASATQPGRDAAATITNRWRESQQVDLDLDEAVIQRAVPGRSYHHHQHVIAADGILYATFSSGRRNEDDVGQEVWFTRSPDKGATWTEPRAIVVPPRGAFAQAVCTATGLHAYREPGSERSTVVAYYGIYEYTGEGLVDATSRKPSDAAHMNTRCMAVYTRDGGESWTAPALILNDVVPNLGPRPLKSGRLLMPGNAVYAYTDDPTGLSGWRTGTLPGLPAGHVDDSAGYQQAIRLNAEELGYCEGSWFQTDDGLIHMMLRTPRNRLSVTESRDNGETWSRVRPTEFTDNCSRHQFGRLPDGRYFALTTPDPDTVGSRTPLVLALSDDGVLFDGHFVLGDEPAAPPEYEGLHKGGRYGYPHLAVVDGVVVALYSVNKEHVATCRFPLEKLDAEEGAAASVASAVEHVPGHVVDHSPSATGIYLGSPGFAVLPDGRYLAKADEFGPASSMEELAVTRVYRSEDGGATWLRVSTVTGMFWSSLFMHEGAAYLMGVEKRYGPLVIRRSTDGGDTWSQPTDSSTGRLLEGMPYHTAPMPVVECRGRLWRAVEEVDGEWGLGFRPFLMSAPSDADLLRADSWTCTNAVAASPEWQGGSFGGWLEGNAVVAPDGRIASILRVHSMELPEKAAILYADPESHAATFDPDKGLVDFPGGCKKFTVRFDPVSGKYWSLPSVAPRTYDGTNVERTRNTLALTCSSNMIAWEVRAILLHHPDPTKHGFQYVDWGFDGDDILALSRTAYDDGMGGAHNQHDANFLTFHRFADFRNLTDEATVRAVIQGVAGTVDLSE